MRCEMENEIILSRLGHTWFFDIDGTVCKHNGYLIDGHDSILPGVKEFFSQIPTDDLVVFVTSRKSKYKELTEAFLIQNSIRFNLIIYDAPYGERIVVNDDKPSGLVMSKAIRLQRNGRLPEHIEIDFNK